MAAKTIFDIAQEYIFMLISKETTGSIWIFLRQKKRIR